MNFKEYINESNDFVEIFDKDEKHSIIVSKRGGLAQVEIYRGETSLASIQIKDSNLKKLFK